MMEDDQQFCLRWNNHQSTLISVFDTLLENEKLVDCTLAAEGRIMKAHKVVLSACSPYFATLLQEQYDKHPIFILKDVKYQELRAMMDYMYRGEVNISQDQLAALLKAAESLQIKGLSDNRTGAPPRAEHQQQQQHHRGLNVPGGSKLSGGYTLEAQSKRARVGAGQLDTQDMSGSREGSSSPSRRRRKVRRRSIENVMAEPHDNSNSSQQQQSSLLQSNAGLAGVSAITAAATALASQLPSVVGSVATPGSTIATTQAIASAQQQQQQQQQQPPQQQQQHQQQQQGQLMPTTTGVTKKTENVKGTTSDAMNTENVLCTVSGSAAVAVDADVMEQQQQHQQHHAKTDKQNHKQKQTSGGVAKDASEMVIEPKSEYDEEGNDETCEDLTLDDEDMGMDDLDQNAGTSQGGEGSSQGYAAWQHDRSQDEILLTQEAQQRDPQDLTRIAQLHKENKAPMAVLSAQIQKTNQRSILNTTERRLAPVRRAIPTNANGPPEINNLTTNIMPTATPTIATTTTTTTSAAAAAATTTTTNEESHLEFQKRLSMVDVSGMLLEFYKTNVAKAPKTQQQQLQLKYRQTSPTSAETCEPSTIAAIATNGAAEAAAKASKNLHGGEVPTKATSSSSSSSSSNSNIEAISNNNMKSMAFHPRIKYTNKNLPLAANDFDGDLGDHTATSEADNQVQRVQSTILTSIPTSVVVPTSPQIDVKPIINPTTGMIIEPTACAAAASVIRPVPTSTSNTKTMPSAAAIAAALLQQQLRAQELQRAKAEGTVSSKILEKLLRQQQRQPQSLEQCKNATNDNNDADDDENDEDTGEEEYEERYANFEDIHLTEDSKQSNYGVSSSMPNIFQASMNAATAAAAGHNTTEYFSTQSQKLLLAQAQAQAMRNLEYSFSDFSGNDSNSGNPNGNRMTSPHNGSDASGEAIYECRHCGKKYRWKSTLRRHENVECGGKEPAHQCPYCPYKSKQRGNLGVHVRKHHSDLPQLASKRRSKYSQNVDNANGDGNERPSSVSFSANASDDSSSKLVIDFSK